MATHAQGNERLLRLAEFLEALPPKRFDYCKWVGTDWLGDAELSCGTTACALGWATTMPEFRKLGLRLETESFAWVSNNRRGVVVDMKNERRGSDAAMRVFALTHHEACFLFLPEYYYMKKTSPGRGARPKTVAKHIRRFVAGRDAL